MLFSRSRRVIVYSPAALAHSTTGAAEGEREREIISRHIAACAAFTLCTRLTRVVKAACARESEHESEHESERECARVPSVDVTFIRAAERKSARLFIASISDTEKERVLCARASLLSSSCAHIVCVSVGARRCSTFYSSLIDQRPFVPLEYHIAVIWVRLIDASADGKVATTHQGC